MSHGDMIPNGSTGVNLRFMIFILLQKIPWLHNQEVDVTFKIRHTPEFMKGKLIREGEIYRIVSSENLQGIASRTIRCGI